MKYLLSVFIFVSFNSHAQFLQKILGTSAPADVTVKWSCPQDTYKSIAQLRTDADVEVSLDQSGNIKLKPDIFKVKLLSSNFIQGAIGTVMSKDRLAVDYAECIADFKKNLVTATKNKTCALCKLTEEELNRKIDTKIESSPYFSKNSDATIIPRFIPGSKKIALEEAKQAVRDFCEQNDTTSDKILSPQFIEALKLDQENELSPVSLDCLDNLKVSLQAKNKELIKKYCPDTDNSFCNQVSTNISSMITSIETIKASKKEKISQFENKKVVATIEIPEEVAAADRKFKENLKADPVSCNDLNAGIKVGDKTVLVSQMDQAINNNLDGIYNKIGPDCAKTFLQNYLTGKEKLISGLNEADEFCRVHKTEKCAQTQNSRSIILNNIDRLMDMAYGEVGQEVIKKALECRLPDSQEPLTAILEKVKDVGEIAKCADLKVGQTQVVSFRDSFINGLSAFKTGDYSLKRLDDKKFQAVLNLGFENAGGQNVSPAEMKARVAACLKDVSPYLKGPNGEQLEILPLDQSEVNKLPPNERPAHHVIKIEEAKFRSNDHQYEENIQCSTITHEILHLFGLADEYNESHGENGNNYQCRVVLKMDSIMKSHVAAFDKAIPKTLSCDCTSSECSSIMNSGDENLKSFYLARNYYQLTDYNYRTKYCESKMLPTQDYSKLESPGKRGLILAEEGLKVSVEVRRFDRDAYPKVTRELIKCQCEDGDKECIDGLSIITKSAVSTEPTKDCPNYSSRKDSELGDKTEGVGLKDGVLRIVSKPEWPSLLHPSQFARILGGGCAQKGASYIECGKDFQSNENCSAPPQCQDDNYYMGYKQ